MDATLATADSFWKLSDEWRRATGILSSSSQRTAHPTFASLVAMGDDLRPILLNELKRGEFVWLELLSAIFVDKGPKLSEEQATSRAAVAEAWIEWGAANSI